MIEYNFWDDRTTECNESDFCPIIMDYCLDQECNECEELKAFVKYWEDRDKEEKRK